MYYTFHYVVIVFYLFYESHLNSATAQPFKDGMKRKKKLKNTHLLLAVSIGSIKEFFRQNCSEHAVYPFCTNMGKLQLKARP